MKIDKFKEKNVKKRLMYALIIVGLIITGGGFILNRSYAAYQESVSFKVMEGTVNYEGSGDVFFTFYKGDSVLDTMPPKDNTDNLGFERAECDKGANIVWNRSKWAPMVTNLKESKTKCKLYFGPKVASDTIYDIAGKDTATLAYDDTNDGNLRYIGKTVNNYIDIGDRDSSGGKILWRIIGVMNNMTVINDDSTESEGQSLVKIIRADSIGNWSWDSSSNSIKSEYRVNNGFGVNEWSQADLMTTLNTEAYWNKTSGQCYNNYDDAKATCDFSSTGLTASVKDKLVKVRWNTGTLGEAYNSSTVYGSDVKFNAKALYTAERSNHNGKEQCVGSGGTYCTDKVERKTTWDGYIGLMYPSDYGYAVGGSVRTECLAKTMHNWDESTPDCKGNDWLYYSSDNQWTITPIPFSLYACNVFRVRSSGYVHEDTAYDALAVRPVAYLKSNIKIKANSASDYGSQSNPFVLES